MRGFEGDLVLGCGRLVSEDFFLRVGVKILEVFMRVTNRCVRNEVEEKLLIKKDVVVIVWVFGF